MATVGKRVQCEAEIVANQRLQGEYFRLILRAPLIAAEAVPGQFVHLRIPGLEHRLLRRPFSICDAVPEKGTLRVVYKVVGEGTRHMASLAPGQVFDAIGPQGQGFSMSAATSDAPALIVAGGYGCAAMLLLAKQIRGPRRCLFGGRSRQDVLLVDEFRALGCDVRISTDDGSEGHHGLVTNLLLGALDDEELRDSPVYACGPHPMLRAVAHIVLARGLDAEVSLDPVMCCGVGACFACVVRRKDNSEQGWQYVRSCLEGPVFNASEIDWDA